MNGVLHQVITYVLIGIECFRSPCPESSLPDHVDGRCGYFFTWFVKAPPGENPLWWFGILLAIFAGPIGLAFKRRVAESTVPSPWSWW